MEVSFAADLVEGYREGHAARYETGVMMELRPYLVDLQALSNGDKSELVGIAGEDLREGSA